MSRLRAAVHDLHHACRTARRWPGLTSTIVATLAIGIGASTAVFALLQGVLLQPLPYPESDRIVWLGHDAPGINFFGLSLSSGMYAIYAERSRELAEIGHWNRRGVTITGGAAPERAVAVAASASLLQLRRRGVSWIATTTPPGRRA